MFFMKFGRLGVSSPLVFIFLGLLSCKEQPGPDYAEIPFFLKTEELS
jgi:hypothetical protein